MTHPATEVAIQGLVTINSGPTFTKMQQDIEMLNGQVDLLKQEIKLLEMRWQTGGRPPSSPLFRELTTHLFASRVSFLSLLTVFLMCSVISWSTPSLVGWAPPPPSEGTLGSGATLQGALGGGQLEAATVPMPVARGSKIVVDNERSILPLGRWENFATRARWDEANASSHERALDASARASAGCTHLQRAFASNASMVLDPAASFRFLSCLQCAPAYAPLECPAGDAYAGGPLPTRMTMRLNDKWPHDPKATARGRAVLRYLNRLNCSMWRRGAFLPCAPLRLARDHPVRSIADSTPHVRFLEPALPPLPQGHPAAGAGLPLCRATNFTALSDGAWEPSTGLWTPRVCRLPYRFPRPALHRCLSGVRLMFMGDSPLRQLSNRLVAYIRGILHVSEHEYGAAAVYRWDGRFDEWAIMPHATASSGGLLTDNTRLNATGMHVGLDLPQQIPGSVDASTFLMLRTFDSKLEHAKAHHALMEVFKPTDLVVGSNYWIRRGNETLTAPARIVKRVRQYVVDRRKAGHPLRSVLWYAFPCHFPGFLPGDGDRSFHEQRDVAVREALEELWAAESGPHGALRDTVLGFLPSCAPARAAGLGAWSTDTVHTACRYDPFPNRQGTSPVMHAMRPTFTLDCSDPISVTNIRVLLTQLCPSLAEREDSSFKADSNDHAPTAEDTLGAGAAASSLEQRLPSRDPAASTLAGPAADRFLLLLRCGEGTSGWLGAMREAMSLAVRLGRVFVLPCVRGGMLVPCVPGHVLPVPPERQGGPGAELRAGRIINYAQEDALAFPAYREDCAGAGRAVLPFAQRAAYPLHAYFSRAGIEEVAASAENEAGMPRGSLRTVDFVDWAAIRQLAPVPLHGHVLMEGVPMLDFGKQFACLKRSATNRMSSAPATVGVFLAPAGILCASSLVQASADEHTAGAAVNVERPLSTGVWATAPDLVVASWMRSSTYRRSDAAPLPALHPAHIIAVERWVRGVLLRSSTEGGGVALNASRFAVVQWRSETLGDRFFGCAAHVVSSIEQLLGRFSSLEASMPLVLVADLPAPANPCGASSNYGRDGMAEDRLGAFARVAGRIAKYDASLLELGLPPLDAGVMSLREYAIAARAEHYFTCNGRFHPVGALCRSCSWISEFIARIVAAREAEGRGSLESFLDHFAIHAAESSSSGTPPALPAPGHQHKTPADLDRLPHAEALHRVRRSCPSGVPLLKCVQSVLDCWGRGTWESTNASTLAMTHAHWEWEPDHGCTSIALPRFTPADWCTVHAGARLLFLGDAASRQAYFATLRLAEEGGLATEPVTVECGNDMDMDPHELGCAAVRVPACDAGLAFVRNDHLALQVRERRWDASTDVLLHPVAPAVTALRPTHIFANRGAHFAVDAAYEAGLETAVGTLRELGSAHVVVRNTPWGHPGCENFTRPHQGPPVAPPPNLPSNWTDFPRQNELMRRIAAAHELLYVDYAAPTSLRPDMHRHSRDCLLYRDDPGNMDSPLHHWVRLNTAAVWLGALLP